MPRINNIHTSSSPNYQVIVVSNDNSQGAFPVASNQYTQVFPGGYYHMTNKGPIPVIPVRQPGAIDGGMQS